VGVVYRTMTKPENLKEIERIERILKAREPKTLHIEDFKPSAVLMIILEKDGELVAVFTKRTETVNSHQGQISFPGGRVDPGDKDREDTALRETLEEVGIPREKIRILGRLDDIQTYTKYIVTPYVGWMQEEPVYILSTDEAERIIEIPLKSFLHRSRFRQEDWDLPDGGKFAVYYFDHGEDVVWGATARILKQFLELVYGF
jgi:8-oxo-dGTP pyrophosphatase MutT (NUDIX family)